MRRKLDHPPFRVQADGHVVLSQLSSALEPWSRCHSIDGWSGLDEHLQEVPFQTVYYSLSLNHGMTENQVESLCFELANEGSLIYADDSVIPTLGFPASSFPADTTFRHTRIFHY
jgi:hypothetical protein